MRGNGRRRRGFIFFYGWRTLHRNEPTPAVDATCPACTKPAQLRGKYAQRWFTLFFIPVAPLETREHAPRFTQCGSCKQQFGEPIESFARRFRTTPVNDHSSAIALYNELRDRPDDSAALLKLLAIYEAMGEPREAESSCRAFPAALAGDARCGEALARIRSTPPGCQG